MAMDHLSDLGVDTDIAQYDYDHLVNRLNQYIEIKNKNESLKEDLDRDLSQMIDEWAEDDFESGQVMSSDDFREFRALMRDNGYPDENDSIYEEAFDAYLDRVMELMSESEYNKSLNEDFDKYVPDWENDVKYNESKKQELADLINDTLYKAFDNFIPYANSMIKDLPIDMDERTFDPGYISSKYWQDFIKGMVNELTTKEDRVYEDVGTSTPIQKNQFEITYTVNGEEHKETKQGATQDEVKQQIKDKYTTTDNIQFTQVKQVPFNPNLQESKLNEANCDKLISIYFDDAKSKGKSFNELDNIYFDETNKHILDDEKAFCDWYEKKYYFSESLKESILREWEEWDDRIDDEEDFSYTDDDYTGDTWGEFSDDEVEDDLMHSKVYGGDPSYCEICGTKLQYEDGYPYCPECKKEIEFEEEENI